MTCNDVTALMANEMCLYMLVLKISQFNSSHLFAFIISQSRKATEEAICFPLHLRARQEVFFFYYPPPYVNGYTLEIGKQGNKSYFSPLPLKIFSFDF